MPRLIVIIVVLLASWAATAADLAGRTSVIDGDTIEIHGQRVRLFGIDAPESRQTCTIAGRPYRCGQEAATALSTFIGGRPVTCERRDIDRYGRIVALCHVGSRRVDE